MHPTTIKRRHEAMQNGLALLVEAAAVFEAARVHKLAGAVRSNAEVAKWEIHYFIEQHGPIVERIKP